MDVIVNLNKPTGITSQQAVTRVKKIFGGRKAGHTGTLDPLATGVLLVCLNEATKITRFFLDMDKKYHARMKLGERTDTLDSEGRVTERRDVPAVTGPMVEEVLEVFRGRISQKPPMYSAVKIGGKALYTLARKGIEIERADRTVDIYELKIRELDIPFIELEISCSKGTYIRTLCDDIGLRLGTCAHLVALQRVAIGMFNIQNAITFDELSSPGFNKPFVAIDEALSGLEEVILNESDARKAKNGMPLILLPNREISEVNFVRLKGPDGKLIGIGKRDFHAIRVERNLNLSPDA